MIVNAMIIGVSPMCESVSIKSSDDILDIINDVKHYISITNIDNSELLCQRLLNIKARIEKCYLSKLITTKQTQITNYFT